MPKRSKIEKDIVVAKNKFHLEIYLGLEGDDISWEIFPEDYHAALYAFSILLLFGIFFVFFNFLYF